jgi:hypothetical protein
MHGSGYDSPCVQSIAGLILSFNCSDVFANERDVLVKLEQGALRCFALRCFSFSFALMNQKSHSQFSEFKKSGLVNDKRWFLNMYKVSTQLHLHITFLAPFSLAFALSQNVFYGKDLVSWLVSERAANFQVSSRADAVAVGI